MNTNTLFVPPVEEESSVSLQPQSAPVVARLWEDARTPPPEKRTLPTATSHADAEREARFLQD